MVGPVICPFTGLQGDSAVGSGSRTSALPTWPHSHMVAFFSLLGSLLNSVTKTQPLFTQTIIIHLAEYGGNNED